MTKLTADRVTETVKACLYDAKDLPADGSAPEGAIIVHGITRGYGFEPAKVEAQKPLIAEMLNELPAEFHVNGGGGWTFLNACNDRNGDQWGEHRNMEDLFALGIAAGLAEWQLPREMWAILPGGMPYVAIKTDPHQLVAA